MALQYYPFGFANITGQPNENEITQYLANITAFKNGVDTARENNAQAMNMAQNLNPATTAGLALGNILGNWGGWRAGQMFQKYLEGNQKPDFQVNPMSQDAINNAVAKIMGTIPSVNGYTPPPDYNFNLSDWRKNQSWQPQNLQNIYSQKYPLTQTPQPSTPTQFNFNPSNFNFGDAAKKISAMVNPRVVDVPFT